MSGGMTDVLAERFAVLADLGDDSDWLDVQRRARRRARFVLPAALVASAVLAVAAVAASSHWIFSTHARQVTAQTRVTVAGKTYRISISTKGAGSMCFSIAPPGKSTGWDSYCGSFGGALNFTDGAGKEVTVVAPGPAFRAIQLKVPGGEVVAGASIGFARRISLTDANGHVYSTQTVAGPRGTKTPLRFWAIGLKGTTARAIAAYDARGRAIEQSLRFP